MTDLATVPITPARRTSVDGIGHAIMDADRTRQALADAGDYESLAWGLDRLAEIRRQLTDVIDATTQDVARLMPEKRVTVDGLGTLERRTGSVRRQWQSAELVSRLVRSSLDPDGTGEIPESVPEAVDAVVRTLTECAPFTGSMGWRVTVLRDRDIDPDEWCESTPDRRSVQIHKADR